MKLNKLFSVMMIVALLAMALAVPTSAQEEDITAVIEEIENWAPAEPMESFRVGIVVKTLVNEPFQLALAEAAKATVEEFGGEGIILAAPTHNDVAEQVAIVEDLVEQQVDGLLLVPMGSDAIVPAVEKANEAGIPVVIADTASYGGDFITFLATDNIAASSMAADYLIEKFDGQAKVAQLEGEPGGQTAADRIKGFQERLAEEPGMELVASQNGHWTTAGGQTTMENILQANPDLNGVFASSDMMGVGAAEAIKAAGMQDQVTLVTFDGLPDGVALIKDGVSDADVAQFPIRMGKWGARVLSMVISGEYTSDDFPKYIDTGAEVVTIATADEYLCSTFAICEAAGGEAEAPIDVNWMPAEEMEPFRIGIVVKTLVNEPFQLALAETAKQTIEKFGGEGIILAAPTHNDVAEQVAIVEDLVEQQVDGLLLVPMGSDAIVPAVEKANEAGIPVVIADTAAYGGDFITFLATDNIAASAMAADYLIEKFDGQAKVAQLEGEPGGQTAADRIKGFQERLAEEPGMELVASQNGHWTTAGGQTTMENILQANPDLNGVFASSDMMGVGAAEAIKAAGKVDQVTLVTFDGLPDGVALIKDGVSDADVAQFPARMGEWGAIILAQVISGEKTSDDYPKYIDTGAKVVTAEIADEYLCDTFAMCE